jgi:hypothetical protein
MPYPNQHSARIKSPSLFMKDSFKTKSIAPGVSIIIGKMMGSDHMTTQAYRFDRFKFTPEQAKAWLKEHSIVAYISFEPATNS